MNRSDVEVLVREAADGQAEAWKTLVEELGPFVWSVVRGHGLNDNKAHDVYQETWFHFAQHVGGIQEPDKAGAWLASTARRLCLKALRPATVADEALAEHSTSDDRMTVDLRERHRSQQTRPLRSASRLTTWASRIAGSHRDTTEWRAHLLGAPEDDIILTPSEQLQASFGFLAAAAQMRVHDAVRPAWRPVDWLLRVPSRTNAFIATAVGTQAVYIVGDGGLGALATEIWEPCGIAGAGMYGLSRWLRRVRGIELATVDRESADQ